MQFLVVRKLFIFSLDTYDSKLLGHVKIIILISIDLFFIYTKTKTSNNG